MDVPTPVPVQMVPTPQACAKLYTSEDKWMVAVFAGLLFAILASPFVFRFTNGLTAALGFEIADSEGCPNMIGIALHAVVFILIVRLLMR